MSTDQEIFFKNYHDRGMKKWAGFYLSEHTAAIESLAQQEQLIVPQKEQLSSLMIQEILQHALLKVQPVAIQLKTVDAEGRYQPDIVGEINGYDSLGIYVNQHKISYENIRHIEEQNFKKWHHE